MSSAHPPQDAGLTLLELVAAMAIFALVAVMGLQAISGSMRARDRLVDVDQQSSAMTRALALLRHDLKSAAPRGFLPPGQETMQNAFLDLSRDDGALVFSAAGQPVLPDDQAAGFSRIIWRLDRPGNRLIRQVWPVLRPATDAALAPETVVLEGITAFEVASYVDEDDGWISGYGTEDQIMRAPLPQAVDIRLNSTLYGPLRVMVTF